MTEALEKKLRDYVTQQLGRAPSQIQKLEAGLGTRQFFRLQFSHAKPRSCIARIESNNNERSTPLTYAPLEALRNELRTRGLPVPRSFGHNDDGIDLLEDGGELDLAQAMKNNPSTQEALLQEAIHWLTLLQAIPKDALSGRTAGRELDTSMIHMKCELFTCYGLPQRLGRALQPNEEAMTQAAFEQICHSLASAPLFWSHRDYQSSNLLVQTSRPAGEQLLWIDFQDLWLAPAEYDLVCLLRDSYWNCSAEEESHYFEWASSRFEASLQRKLSRQRYEELGLIRKSKDLARFHQAASQRNDQRYLRYSDYTWSLILRAARWLAPRNDDPLGSFCHWLSQQGEA